MQLQCLWVHASTLYVHLQNNSLGLRIYVSHTTHRPTGSLLEQNPLWYSEFCLPSLFSPAEGKRHCLASYLHKQLLHLKPEGGFWHARSSHCYSDAFYFPKHSSTLHYHFYLPKTFSNYPGQPALFTIINYQSFCHLSRIRDFPGTLLLKNPYITHNHMDVVKLHVVSWPHLPLTSAHQIHGYILALTWESHCFPSKVSTPTSHFRAAIFITFQPSFFDILKSPCFYSSCCRSLLASQSSVRDHRHLNCSLHTTQAPACALLSCPCILNSETRDLTAAEKDNGTKGSGATTDMGCSLPATFNFAQ